MICIIRKFKVWYLIWYYMYVHMQIFIDDLVWKLLICSALFSLANLITCMTAKILSRQFYRSAHMDKLQSALEKEMYLVVGGGWWVYLHCCAFPGAFSRFALLMLCLYTVFPKLELEDAMMHSLGSFIYYSQA